MTKNQDGAPPSTDKLHKAYHAKSSKETADVYNDWAEEYEQHMRNVGYTHPAMVASMASRHVEPTDQPVLDAGAGSGVPGEILTALGFSHIVGLDASEGRLKIADLKNNYRQLTHQYLGDKLISRVFVFRVV